MVNNRRKYILVPEYRPLYAMTSCYGPSHGPLQKPILTPLDIIRKLLLQSGKEKLTIMEVVKTGNGKFSEPVQLTLDNYTLTYEEIVAGKTIGTNKPIIKAAEPPKPVKPTVVSKKLEIKTEPEPVVTPEPTAEPADEEVTFENVETTEEVEAPPSLDSTPEPEPEVVEEKPEEPATDTSDVDVFQDNSKESTTSEVDTSATTNPYAGMTKAQRKAARRAAAQAAASEANNT